MQAVPVQSRARVQPARRESVFQRAEASATLRTLQRSGPNHYATLGLDRLCSNEQIRAAYRVLARQHQDRKSVV